MCRRRIVLKMELTWFALMHVRAAYFISLTLSVRLAIQSMGSEKSKVQFWTLRIRKSLYYVRLQSVVAVMG